MSTDDDFAQHLRARVDGLAPHVTVHTAHVVPRARRRRARVRSAQAVGVVGALAVVGVGADGLTGWTAPWRTAGPFAPATSVPSDEATAVATLEPTAAPTEDPAGGDDPDVAPTEEAVATPTGTYWYTRSTITDEGGTETLETWRSREFPGLIVEDGDLTAPGAMGPSDVIGRYFLDGQWVDMLRDPAALPTDGAALEAVLRASVEPDRRQGSEDDKVVEMARELLATGRLLPEPLLRAAWDAAATVAGGTVSTGSDSTGRSGEVVTYAGTQGEVRLVRDPVTGLLLEQATPHGTTTYLVQEFTDAIPIEPTLEIAGCFDWATC